MNNAEKKLFLSKLKTETGSQLLKTLDFFRNNGDCDLIPDVLNLLETNTEQEIADNVLQLVSDLKNPAASDSVFDYMVKTATSATRKQLITALWQSEADFSHKGNDIVRLILDADNFETAFEALTLLENNAMSIVPDTAKDLLALIKAETEHADDNLLGIYTAAQEHLAKAIASATED